jgi:hypothetical protein
MDHLLVNLHLADSSWPPFQREPILCIPHGNGGLMGPADARRLAVWIERADDGDNDGRVLLHLARHAHGQVSAHANLRGASFMVADKPADIERWEKRCAAHRASSDQDRSGTDSLALHEAIEMAASLDRCGLPGFTPSMLRRCVAADGACAPYIAAERAIRDGMILHSVSSDGGLHDVGLTPAEFVDLARQGFRVLAVDPYDCDGNLRANLDPRILAAHVKQTPVASVGGSTCAA